MFRKNSKKQSTVPELTPTVLWAQTKEELYLTVEIVKVDDYKVDVTKEALKFNGTKDSNSYKFEILFLKPILPEKVKHNSQRNIKIKIPKAEAERWTSINKDGKKHWLKCDWDRWVDSDDEGAKPFGFEDFDMDNFDMGDFSNMGNFDNMGSSDGDEDEDADGDNHCCSKGDSCKH